MSEDTDVFVITPNRRTFFCPETENLNLVTEKCLEIEDVLKFECLEACTGKKAAFGWLGQPLKPPKFKFSVLAKKNVHLFGVMTKTSALSDKNVPLPPTMQIGLFL